MRRVLVTGLGGAGRTTVAASAALACAARGRRTLLLSPAADVPLERPVTGTPEAPTAVADRLWVARTDPAGDFRAEFLDLQQRLATGLDLLGAARLEEDELTELPGSGAFALLRSLAAASRGDWDVLVVDMPPLAEALAALALPEELRRYLRRLLPPERQAARALRPVLAQLAGVPMPAQWLYETAARWDAELAGVQALVASRGTGLALVAEPGPAAADALRTGRAGLSLFGHRLDALVANRCVPGDSPDPWLASLAAQQHKCTTEWRAVPPGGPAGAVLVEVPHLGRDPRGPEDLEGLGTGPLAPALDGDGPPSEDGADGARPAPWSVLDRRTEDGTLTLRLPLPGAVKEELSLVRRGDELLLTVGPFRRIVPLPSALRRCTVSGAALREGVLGVRFTPDPGLWPRTR
ncbi:MULTISPECIES: ArsA family ATPase [unclassified Streptomyces]|uniref:ArsA family ATPase n=1 Tax=unclassified Streptomyces TaxID=2593676 RepID=UPI0038012A34